VTAASSETSSSQGMMVNLQQKKKKRRWMHVVLKTYHSLFQYTHTTILKVGKICFFLK